MLENGFFPLLLIKKEKYFKNFYQWQVLLTFLSISYATIGITAAKILMLNAHSVIDYTKKLHNIDNRYQCYKTFYSDSYAIIDITTAKILRLNAYSGIDYTKKLHNIDC